MRNDYQWLYDIDEKHIKYLEKCVKDTDYANFPWWKKIWYARSQHVFDTYHPYWVRTLAETKEKAKKTKERFSQYE